MTATGQAFIQVHRSSEKVELIAVLDHKVINYQVLDLVYERGFYYVFAVRELPSENYKRTLSMIQVGMDAETDSHHEPAMQYIELSKEQCGDRLEVSLSLVVLSCLKTKTITVFRRSTMA